jgi:hypothetical protein
MSSLGSAPGTISSRPGRHTSRMQRLLSAITLCRTTTTTTELCRRSTLSIGFGIQHCSRRLFGESPRCPGRMAGRKRERRQLSGRRHDRGGLRVGRPNAQVAPARDMGLKQAKCDTTNLVEQSIVGPETVRVCGQGLVEYQGRVEPRTAIGTGIAALFPARRPVETRWRRSKMNERMSE